MKPSGLAGLPPEKWSSLMYGLWPDGELKNRKKRRAPEEIVTKLRQVDVLVSRAVRSRKRFGRSGVTEVTYYRWRSEYGGLKGDQVKRLKELKTEQAIASCGL